MLIVPVQLPPVPGSQAQTHAVANTLPQVLTQAVAPIGQQAVAPAPRCEKNDKTKERRQKDRREERRADEEPGRGDFVNFSV